MNNTLTRYKLSQLIEVSRGQSLAGEFYAEQGDVMRLTLANFDYQNGGFKEDVQKSDIYYTGTVKPQCLLNEGDIITPLTEQTPGLLGSTARIPVSGKYVQSGDVALVKCNEELIDPSFCYYLLPSSQVKKQLAAGSQQTKIRHTSPDAIKNCIVDIPNLDQQRKIGKLLDAITAKIDENRKQNDLLEKMAKQLYDYWFVQFDFPDENGRPYKSSGGAMVYNEKLKREIPKGWECKKLENILDVISRRTTIESAKSLNYAPIEVIPRNKMSFHECAPIEKAVSGLCEFEKKHILLSNRRVYFHKVCIAPFDGITRDTVIVFQPKIINSLAYSFQIVNSDSFIGYATQQSYGSEQPVLSWTAAKEYKVAFPSQHLIDKYCEKMNDFIELVLDNENEQNYLKKLRNVILPLLMTGQATLK